MKMKPEHYQHIKESMAKIADKIPAHRERMKEDPRIKDLDKRVRWDWLWGTGLSSWMSANLYKYLNDSHIDTALKQIAKELTP